MLRAYNRLLHERPFSTNVVVGGALGSVGDVLAQWLRHRGETGWRRVEGQSCAAAAAWGAANNGVFVPWWYRTLDARLPGTAVRAVACKSCLDIAVQGGLGNAAGIAARGAPLAEVLRSMPMVLLYDCVVWMPYNFLAFGRIPPHLRPTTTAFMTLGWNTYLSAVAAQGRTCADDAAEAHDEPSKQ